MEDTGQGASRCEAAFARIANALVSKSSKPKRFDDDGPTFVTLSEYHDRRAGIAASRRAVRGKTGQDNEEPDCHDTRPNGRKSNNTFTFGLAV